MTRIKKLNVLPFIHMYFILTSMMFVLPFMIVVSASLTSEEALIRNGFTIIPQRIDLTAYQYAFSNSGELLQSYLVTGIQAFGGTIVGVLVMSLMAYTLSRHDFILRRQLSFMVFFTLLFNGGLVPTYLLNYKYLKLGDTMWIYILPTMCNAFYIIILRTFFQSLPKSLVESAKMDGASELTIFLRIIMPLSKPVLATVSLLTLLQKWNDWYTSLLYITDKKLYTLQYLLNRILSEAEFLRQLATEAPPGIDLSMLEVAPVETLKFAMCIIAAGPMLFIFPFFQKYFSKGLTVGAVKG